MLRTYNQRRASTEHDELFGQRSDARCELRTSFSKEGDGRDDALMAFGLDTDARQCQRRQSAHMSCWHRLMLEQVLVCKMFEPRR